MIESAAELRTVQQNACYPPRGRRGIGGERSATWGLRIEEYVRTANDDIMLIPMIESAAGYHNLDEILDVDATEAIFMGPVDMAASYGYPFGDSTGIHSMIDDVVRRSTARGVRVGIGVSGSGDAVQRTEQGFGLVSLGTDTGLMIQQIEQLRAALPQVPLRRS